MPVLYCGDEEQIFDACNRSALRRKGWKDIDEFSALYVEDAQYIVCQYDKAACDPQVLVGLAEYNPATSSLEQVGFTQGFRLDRIEYFMSITPTSREYSERRMENVVLSSMEVAGLMVGA